MRCRSRMSSLRVVSLSVCICVLSSCGGGNGNDTSQALVGNAGNMGSEQTVEQSVDQIDELIEQPLVQSKTNTLGTVIIEERNGKTIFDGWYVSADDAEFALASDAKDPLSDQCQLSSNNTSSSIAFDKQWLDLKPIGDRVEISSREGRVEALEKQTSGDVVVYAADERWLSDALPDDALIVHESDEAFEGVSSVAVPALQRLVLLTPAKGYLASVGSEVSWEASAKEDTRVKLKYSAIDFSDQDSPRIVSVDCNVADDGSFILSDDMRAKFDNTESNIVVYAVRARTQQVQNNNALLRVVQLSYPAPVKP